MTEEPRP